MKSHYIVGLIDRSKCGLKRCWIPGLHMSRLSALCRKLRLSIKLTASFIYQFCIHCTFLQTTNMAPIDVGNKIETMTTTISNAKSRTIPSWSCRPCVNGSINCSNAPAIGNFGEIFVIWKKTNLGMLLFISHFSF